MNFFTELAGSRMLFFDGGMGTLLQDAGLKPGELPESWNITHPQDILSIHLQYLQAGADFVTTNTFGANALKLHGSPYTAQQLTTAGVQLARQAVQQSGKKAWVALDIGPTGKLLKP